MLDMNFRNRRNTYMKGSKYIKHTALGGIHWILFIIPEAYSKVIRNLTHFLVIFKSFHLIDILVD